MAARYSAAPPHSRPPAGCKRACSTQSCDMLREAAHKSGTCFEEGDQRAFTLQSTTLLQAIPPPRQAHRHMHGLNTHARTRGHARARAHTHTHTHTHTIQCTHQHHGCQSQRKGSAGAKVPGRQEQKSSGSWPTFPPSRTPTHPLRHAPHSPLPPERRPFPSPCPVAALNEGSHSHRHRYRCLCRCCRRHCRCWKLSGRARRGGLLQRVAGLRVGW